MQGRVLSQMAQRWLLLVLLAGCTPALDWREVHAPQAALHAQFPCKPQQVAQAAMGLLQCEAGSTRFVLSWLEFKDPDTLRRALAEQATHLAQRHQAQAKPLKGTLPAGRLDWPGTGRFALVNGAQPAWVLVWAKGLRLHQALVLAAPASAAAEPAHEFFDGIRTQ